MVLTCDGSVRSRVTNYQISSTKDDHLRLYSTRTSPKKMVSTGWLSLDPSARSKIELFDSFGLDPKLYSLDQSLSSFTYSIRHIQKIGTNVCGHYALLFIYLRSRGRSFEYTINSLDKNFTDASAARKMIDLALSKLSHVHCTGQTCKIKS